MTAANVILLVDGEYHLFSVGSDGYPDSIGRIVTCCEELIQANPDEAPDGVSEFILRTDSCYVYLMDFDTKQARCWRNRSIGSGLTLHMLIEQTKKEIELNAWQDQLPEGWQIVPKSCPSFTIRPLDHLKRMASRWDEVWGCLDLLSQQLEQLSVDKLRERFRSDLPIVPLALPYRKPVYWSRKKVQYLTRNGIWLEISTSPWQLNRVDYDQLTAVEMQQIFSAWLESA